MTKQTENQLRQRIAEEQAVVTDLEKVIAGQTATIIELSGLVKGLQLELRQKNTAISLRDELFPQPHKESKYAKLGIY
jgi:hypothetical protein